MAKATTIKEALAKFEEKNECKASEAKTVKQLSLSSNCIEKIANLNGLKNLKILSLGRNNIKSLTGLDAVGDTLKELWISYNLIEKLKGINVLKKLEVLYISNNQIKDWGEVQKMSELPCLVELNFVGNPVEVAMSEDNAGYRDKMCKYLKPLKKLDGVPIVRDEEGEES